MKTSYKRMKLYVDINRKKKTNKYKPIKIEGEQESRKRQRGF